MKTAMILVTAILLACGGETVPSAPPAPAPEPPAPTHPDGADLLLLEDAMAGRIRYLCPSVTIERATLRAELRASVLDGPTVSISWISYNRDVPQTTAEYKRIANGLLYPPNGERYIRRTCPAVARVAAIIQAHPRRWGGRPQLHLAAGI